MKEVQDHYFQKAKKEGYVARSAFKLQEIDQKHKIFRRGMRVLDLGCAPGSWLQYSAKQVGKNGHVLGIDLSEVTITLPECVQVHQADIFAEETLSLFEGTFDLIISDMAPKTTGIRSVDAQRSHNLCEQVLWLANSRLKTGGTLLVKAFQGGTFDGLRKNFQEQYQKVKICKPKSSRNESVEVFLLGLQKKDSPPETFES